MLYSFQNNLCLEKNYFKIYIFIFSIYFLDNTGKLETSKKLVVFIKILFTKTFKN